MSAQGVEPLKQDVVVGNHLLVFADGFDYTKPFDRSGGCGFAFPCHVSDARHGDSRNPDGGELHVHRNPSAIGMLRLDIELGAAHRTSDGIGVELLP
jgi:hypothetical protein